MKSTAKEVRFGVAGLGRFGACHLFPWQWLLEESVDAKIQYFADRDSLKAAAKLWPGNFILFSNFPPDAVEGVTYKQSKESFAELFLAHPNLELHIITNAPPKNLCDHEVFSLSSTGRVTIQRAQEWADYSSCFLNHVIRRLWGSLEGTGQTVMLRPGFSRITKTSKPTPEVSKRHLELIGYCQNRELRMEQPSNSNVDDASFRIWQRSKSVFAARTYAEVSGD